MPARSDRLPPSRRASATPAPSAATGASEDRRSRRIVLVAGILAGLGALAIASGILASSGDAGPVIEAAAADTGPDSGPDSGPGSGPDSGLDSGRGIALGIAPGGAPGPVVPGPAAPGPAAPVLSERHASLAILAAALAASAAGFRAAGPASPPAPPRP